MMKISKDKAFSIMESLFFMSAEPKSLTDLSTVFQDHFSSKELQDLIKEFQNTYNKQDRGLRLEKVKKGWQLRTKIENKPWIVKLKPSPLFRLSKPALETLSIIAFEQPCPKSSVDEIRGVDSGHLLRTLIEKEMICPAGKSDLPGRPLLYKTTGKFLETFGFESLKDLPSDKEIEELAGHSTKTTEGDLSSVSTGFAKSHVNIPYQKDEEESRKIKEQLKSLPSSVDFLKQNKSSDESESRSENESEKNESESD